MKQVFTSAGFLALGAVSLHAYDPEMTRQNTGHPWSISAVVRAFYDDNVTTSPDKTRINFAGASVEPQDSLGLEVSPSIHLNLPIEQTFVSLGYVYSLKWYEDRDPHDTDQSHEFNGRLRHQFSPRHDISVSDALVITSEPTVADRFGIVTAPTRTDSDILHNRGSIEHNYGFTPKFAVSLGYMNNWYDYEQEDAPGSFGSRSSLLDRIEHLIRADLRYQVNPTLVGLVGYSFGIGEYTGDGVIGFNPTTGAAIPSDERDVYSHYIYVGGDYDITAKLRASLRAGAQFTDYHNAGEDSVNPYVDASASYIYAPNSSATLGVLHTRSATDLAGVDASGTPTLDAEATAFYGRVSHRILRNLTGSLIAQYQMSEFNEGLYDGENEDLFLVGINFDYQFNRHFSAEFGYNFDMLDSDIQDTNGTPFTNPNFGRDARSYDRNRVYIGLRATY
jgi:predicted porin